MYNYQLLASMNRQGASDESGAVGGNSVALGHQCRSIGLSMFLQISLGLHINWLYRRPFTRYTSGY